MGSWRVDKFTSLQVACSDKLQLTVVIIIMDSEFWIVDKNSNHNYELWIMNYELTEDYELYLGYIKKETAEQLLFRYLRITTVSRR